MARTYRSVIQRVEAIVWYYEVNLEMAKTKLREEKKHLRKLQRIYKRIQIAKGKA